MTEEEYAKKYDGRRVQLLTNGRFGIVVGFGHKATAGNGLSSTPVGTKGIVVLVEYAGSNCASRGFTNIELSNSGWKLGSTSTRPFLTTDKFYCPELQFLKLCDEGAISLPKTKSEYPHVCYCKEPAYITALTVECSSPKCRHYKGGPVVEPASNPLDNINFAINLTQQLIGSGWTFATSPNNSTPAPMTIPGAVKAP